MKLTKENIYINLQGKSKEELTNLYNFLESVGEKQYDILEDFLNDDDKWTDYEFYKDEWVLSSDRISLKEKTKVTIEQLKELLKQNSKI